MFNPWLILGVVLLVIAAAFGGYKQGRKVESAEWLQKENKELAAANAKILKLEQDARNAEHAHAAAVDLISTTLQGQTDAAKAETERLRTAARIGAFRLRDPSGKNACGSATGSAAAAPGQRDGQAGSDLSGAASEFLLGLTGEADEVVRQLVACQAVIIDDRKTP